MTVRVPGGHVEVVEDAGSLDQLLRHNQRKLGQETGDDVAPCLLAEVKVERLDGLLGRLVGSEAGPLVVAGTAGALRVGGSRSACASQSRERFTISAAAYGAFASSSRLSRLMELAGLEPATSWVRSRRSPS